MRVVGRYSFRHRFAVEVEAARRVGGFYTGVSPDGGLRRMQASLNYWPALKRTPASGWHCQASFMKRAARSLR
jgi:hypothetical protein